MTVQSAQSVTVMFSTRIAATSVGTIADSLPTGTLYQNGVANAASVTVTNISGGVYKAQVTMPTLAAGDQVELMITATVSGITDTANVWGDTNDFIGSAGALTTVTTATNLTTYTGNTPQTGDAYARIGAPAGASVSADVAAIKANATTLVTGVNVSSMNGATVYGNGSSGNLWRGTP